MWKDEETEYDTITGEALDPKLVQAGKEEEMKRFKEMGVYAHVSEQEALDNPEGIMVDVRWVIVNKGSVGAQCALPLSRQRICREGQQRRPVCRHAATHLYQGHFVTVS